MGYVVLGVLLAAAVLLLIYDLRFADGHRRRKVIMVDALFVLIAGAAIIYGVIANVSYKEDKDKFYVTGDDLVGAVRYLRTENDCYIFSQSQLMSSAALIAVPKDDASLPSLTVLYPYVMIYSQWGAESYTADFPSGSCEVLTGVVKIVPEHIGFAFLTALFSLTVIFIYNLINFIRTFAERRKAAKGSDKN